MQLINSLGEIVEFETSDSLYSDKIFEIDDSTLLKVEHLYDGKSISPLKTHVFDILKTIKHENFINLIERYHRVPQTSENVEAYTYEHIKGNQYNLLHLKTDFMIEQFRGIQNLFEIFSSEGIEVFDAGSCNSIVLKDRIIIIDPDFYRIVPADAITKSINNERFCYFMEGYFSSSMCNEEMFEKLFYKITEEKDPVLALEKRLKGCKRPIDYFHK